MADDRQRFEGRRNASLGTKSGDVRSDYPEFYLKMLQAGEQADKVQYMAFFGCWRPGIYHALLDSEKSRFWVIGVG